MQRIDVMRLAVVLLSVVMGTSARLPGSQAPRARTAAAPVRQTLSFDADWRFYKGEPPAPAMAQPLSPNYAPIDPASFAFKDDAWRRVDLPHDWSIEGPFAKENPTMAAGGYLPSGVAWYRKTFTVPAEAKGKRVWVEFDGVMSNSKSTSTRGCWGRGPAGMCRSAKT